MVSDVVWIHRDHMHHMAEVLAAEGFAYLHCPDSTCGHFTVLSSAEAYAWRCPLHDAEGVIP